MTANQYLDNDEVIEFISWLGPRLDQEGALMHAYVTRKGTPRRWNCNSLYSAFEAYQWQFSCKSLNRGGSTFGDSAGVLADLQGRLRKAVDAGANGLAANACVGILEWGGLTNKNAEWVQSRAATIGNILRTDHRLLTPGS